MIGRAGTVRVKRYGLDDTSLISVYGYTGTAHGSVEGDSVEIGGRYSPNSQGSLRKVCWSIMVILIFGMRN
jgi:hypothetical protein